MMLVESISKKLIYRHPHVYQNKKNISQEQVKKNWEKLKLKEGQGKYSFRSSKNFTLIN